jgi:hypothetical protein
MAPAVTEYDSAPVSFVMPIAAIFPFHSELSSLITVLVTIFAVLVSIFAVFFAFPHFLTLPRIDFFASVMVIDMIVSLPSAVPVDDVIHTDTVIVGKEPDIHEFDDLGIAQTVGFPLFVISVGFAVRRAEVPTAVHNIEGPGIETKAYADVPPAQSPITQIGDKICIAVRMAGEKIDDAQFVAWDTAFDHHDVPRRDMIIIPDGKGESADPSFRSGNPDVKIGCARGCAQTPGGQ